MAVERGMIETFAACGLIFVIPQCSAAFVGDTLVDSHCGS